MDRRHYLSRSVHNSSKPGGSALLQEQYQLRLLPYAIMCMVRVKKPCLKDVARLHYISVCWCSDEQRRVLRVVIDASSLTIGIAFSHVGLSHVQRATIGHFTVVAISMTVKALWRSMSVILTMPSSVRSAPSDMNMFEQSHRMH